MRLFLIVSGVYKRGRESVNLKGFIARTRELTAFSKFGWEENFAVDKYREWTFFPSSDTNGDIGILIFENILLNVLSNCRGFEGPSVFWIGTRPLHLLLEFTGIDGRT